MGKNNTLIDQVLLLFYTPEVEVEYGSQLEKNMVFSCKSQEIPNFLEEPSENSGEAFAQL